MKISIIIPLYHGKKHICGIIDMIQRNEVVLQNDYKNKCELEVIFVNDDPEEIIDLPKDCLDNNSICYILINHEKNSGIHKSRVSGLEVSTGDYILFLDQDDKIAEHYLISQLNILTSGDGDWVISNGYFRNDHLIYPNHEAVKNVISDTHYFSDLKEIISPGQVLLKRDVIPDIWMTCILNKNYCDDAFLWMLLKNSKKKSVYNDKIIYFHIENGNNTSFSWQHNADALSELKKTIINRKCLSVENTRMFLETVDNEINKQILYQDIENRFEQLKEGIFEISNRIDKNIVIYGYGIWGRKLHVLLKDYSYNIELIIDKAIKNSVDNITVCDINDIDDEIVSAFCDCMVCVTVPSEFNSIKSQLIDLGFTRVFSITDILDIAV